MTDLIIPIAIIAVVLPCFLVSFLRWSWRQAGPSVGQQTAPYARREPVVSTELPPPPNE